MKRIFYSIIIKIYKFFIIGFIKTQKKVDHLGTYYGGYDIYDSNSINIVLSCGLGEDASFDVELINKYNCKVIIVDPTPRAITHFKQIQSRFGKKKIAPYNKNSGTQSVESYELTKVNSKNICLIQKAIFHKNAEKLKLFFPNNKEFVSTSFEKDENYSQKYFLAETINLKNIMKEQVLKKIDILKLDIEGGEIIVLYNMIQSMIFPDQILVEYKNINSANFFKFLEIYKINKILKKNGYTIINVNGKGDFTYLKN